MTTHDCTQHPPGTRACYTIHRCRCVECGKASTRYQNIYRGRRQPSMVDAAEARAHILRLLRRMTRTEIADAADYSRSCLRKLIAGSTRRIRRETAERILAVQPVKRTEMVIAEVEFLAGSDHPEAIAHRLGYGDPRNLERVLYRAGRGDLWQRIAPRERLAS